MTHNERVAVVYVSLVMQDWSRYVG